jgi:hypothetical protein
VPTAVLPGRPISVSMLVPLHVARVGSPELGDGGRAPCPRAHWRTGCVSRCLDRERTPNTLWSGGTVGLVAWQPPHRQDEDLVPLTAGACSPRRRSSRRIPRQTSRPDSSLMTAAAQRRGDTVRRPNLAQTPLPDGRPLARLGEAALGCVRIGSEPIWPTARARPQVSSGQETRRSSLRTTGPLPPPYRSSPSRPALFNRLVGRCQSEGGQRRRRSGSGHAPPALIGVARIAERARCSGWFVATRAGYSPTARRAATRDVTATTHR